MKTKWNGKAKLAGALAALMVFSVITPGAEAFAAPLGLDVNPDDPVKIIFDPGIGPGLNESTYQSATAAGESLVIDGKAGQYLEGNPKLPSDGSLWVPTADGKRLKFPDFTSPLVNVWNYKFGGWIDGSGQVLSPDSQLDPRFQYESTTTYRAKWDIDPSKKYKYNVKYYRDNLPSRDLLPADNPNAWPADESQIWKIKPGEWKEGVPVSIGVPVTIPYPRNIPGYKLKDVLIKNNLLRSYDGTVLPDPDRNKGVYVTASGDNVNVGGNMPNDNLTVGFRYTPDTAKTFPVTIRCVDKQNNPIKLVKEDHPAETVFTVTPPEIQDYTVQEGSFTDGGVTEPDTGLISASDLGSNLTPDGSLRFQDIHMPNQPLVITYTYKPTINPLSDVTVSYWEQVNGSDIPLLPPDGAPTVVELPLNPDDTPGSVQIAIPEIGGYQFNTFLTSDKFTASLASDKSHVTATYNGMKNSLKLYYVRNNDPAYWGKVTFGFDPSLGTLKNAPEELKFKTSEGMTVDELTSGIQILPKEHYAFDGWYVTNDAGTAPAGERLEGTKLIRTTTKLFAKFIEKSDEWYNITFQSGAYGSISSSGVIHTNSTLTPTWQQLQKPAPFPSQGYLFDCWVDEAGNRILADSDMPIMSSQKYTAVFVPIGVDGILARPDASGEIRNDGSGTITVSGASPQRKYALTDSRGIILEAVNGALLANSRKFDSKLAPCTDYRVYELSAGTNPQKGNRLPGDGITESQISNPALAHIPALGSNYRVEADDSGKMKLVINPAADETQYAILDGTGAQVMSEGTDGWVTSAGGQAILGGLDGKQLYTVVARKTGEATEAADKAAMGTQLSIAQPPQSDAEYTLELLNGAYVSNYNGTPIAEGQVTKMRVHKKDTLLIAAPSVIDGMPRSFNRWHTVIGPNVISNVNNSSQEIHITDSNLVISAEYAPLQTATWSNASIAFTSNAGTVGLDLSEERQEDLKRELTGNPADENALTHHSSVTYTIKINRRTPKASESNAIRKEVSDSSVRVPWAITASIGRKVGSVNQEIPEGVNQNVGIRLFSDVDRSVQGYSDYALWEIAPDGTLSQLTMEPDPNDESSGFTGMVSFDAKTGYTYLVSYLQAYTVSVIDHKKPGNSMDLLVLPDTPLSDAPSYADLDKYGITGSDGGLTWEYAGLTKKNESQAQLIDPADPVTKNATLYVLYDDSKWKAASRQLSAELDVAKALMENASVTIEDKGRLQGVITPALSAVNDHNISFEGLNQLWSRLKAVVDSVIIPSPEPTPDPDNPSDPSPDQPDIPTPPDPTPPAPNPPKPGGGGSGGGGGAGGSGGPGFAASNTGYSFNRYKTYFTGEEGNWVDEGDGQKAYVLTDGTRLKNQWANITLDETRDTKTYHFNGEGLADHGWFKDTDGQWYYLKETPGADYGSLSTGWHYDEGSGKWYYLNQFSGSMATGWQQVGNEYYYLSPASEANRPLGSMYAGERTPDGYQVDQSGRWNREMPR